MQSSGERFLNILGISGFENSIPFKRSRWPGREEREYRISQGHDSAAALVVGGTLVAAAAEERFTRQKHTGAFPRLAAEACLRHAGLGVGDLDLVLHGFNHEPYRMIYASDPVSRDQFARVYSRDALLQLVRRDLPGLALDRVRQMPHHLAHAASAYYTSGWDECLVVIVDGMGEVDAASVYHARGGKLERIFHLGARHSIGILYSLVTLHLGFDFNADEYKIMGLAPYGDAERFRAFFDDTVRLEPDGGIRIPILRENESVEDRQFYLGTRAQLAERLVARREPDGPILDVHRDVAASLQACLDRTTMHLCAHFAKATGLRRLALAGGVALNCTANGKLLRSGLFDDIYIQPAAGDDGTALGAALLGAAEAGEVRVQRMDTPFLGPGQGKTDIEAALAAFGDRIEATDLKTLGASCTRAADLIRQGRVVGWYRGRMEFGPRALGHRSILADPGHPDMRDRINAMVKMRESFRPFAPAVAVEEASRWFEVADGAELPYMIIIVSVRPEHRADLPAVTHVDGTARVQTVSPRDNAEFHELLQAVGRATGRKMVLNTSFNVKGQPIVRTAAEAVETFLGTGIEHLFLENVLVSRKD